MIYYRGSSSYADAVTNQLNTLEETGLVTSQAISNLESGITSEIQDLRSDFQTAAVGLYNQGQEIRNDIQASTAMNINAIQGMAMGITSDIRESTYAVVASQRMLAKTFNQGFSSVNNTINLGFGLVGNKIDVLSEEVSSKLDEIQDILNNPRLTQSRELYREALRSYKRGFYEEALEDCLGAIEKNKTDYISWYLLGLIYLYGAGENSNVINLDKAEEAFTNAAKYIKPDIAKSDEAKLFASDIYYNLGFSRLAKSNDYLIENKVDDSNTKLLEAEEASRTSYQLSKENLLARYEHAKSLHFLGKDDEVLKILEELIRKEKNFAIKSMNDENFKSLWSCIEKLIEKLKLEVCNQIKNKIKETIDFYENKLKANDEIANYELPRNYRTSNIEVFQKKQNELKLRYADIENNDYFTVLNLKKQLSGDLDNFSNEISNLIHDTKTAIEQKLAEERRIQQEKREREQAELRRQEEERERQEREERRRKEEEIEKQKREEERRRQDELRREEEERKRQEEERRQKIIKRLKASVIITSLLLGVIIGIIGFVVFQDMNMSSLDLDDVLPLAGWICLVFGVLWFILRVFYMGIDALWGSLLVAFITFIVAIFFMACVGDDLPLISIAISTVFFMLLGIFIAKDTASLNFKGLKEMKTILAVFFAIISVLCISCTVYYKSGHYYTNMLFKAIKKHDVEKVEKFINEGANINAKKGKSGSPPLFYVLNSIHPGVNKRYNKIYDEFFIKLGDCETENVYKNIEHFGLEWYVEPFEIFDLLINAGADVNAQNTFGVTPLMLSTYFLSRCTNEETDEGIFKCIEKLIELGADVNAKTVSGITALQINEYGHYYYSKENKESNMKYKKKVIDLLRKNGAK